ncbi:hypothetical protein FSP39_002872 [Pinctada imbricata]|uniref:BTB domain-containing protein n=1 Tax=Pinctada imbricata TaxID=66713 RepID=A0AA88YPK9_PINIB|nr:hypothetical protein FSP39_002872 [Pinctada imbricata]
MNYQKVYMNQIYSSSLMGQVAQMWKDDILCDAVIKTGNVQTKAHRLVMIAACPVLQHMENASLGSHLEVRLSSEIKKDSVLAFLQYLYEGFMMLSEDNCKDIEKIGKLLHVDSVVKCCKDFFKCLSEKLGSSRSEKSSFRSSSEQPEFQHVRTSSLQKMVPENANKRAGSEESRPQSPMAKRKRTQRSVTPPSFSLSSDDSHSRSREHGRSVTREDDTLVVVSSECPERDEEGWPVQSDAPPLQKQTMTFSISRPSTGEKDLRVVNIPASAAESQPSTAASNSHTSTAAAPSLSKVGENISPSLHTDRSRSASPVQLLTAKPSTVGSQGKSFAAGSAEQAVASQRSCDQGTMGTELEPDKSTMSNRTSKQRESPHIPEGKTGTGTDRSGSQGQRGPDMTIIKVEHPAEGLEMSVDNEAPQPLMYGMDEEGDNSSDIEGATGDMSRDNSLAEGDLNVAWQDSSYQGDSSRISTFLSSSTVFTEVEKNRKSDRGKSLPLTRPAVSTDSKGLDVQTSDLIGKSLTLLNSLPMTLENSTWKGASEIVESNLSETESSNRVYNVSETASNRQEKESTQSANESKKLMDVLGKIDKKLEFLSRRVTAIEVEKKQGNDAASTTYLQYVPDVPSTTEIPEKYRTDMETLKDIERNAKQNPGNFALKLTQRFFPELFGPDCLRKKFNWYGSLNKKRLDPVRCNVIRHYVSIFYPEINDENIFKRTVVLGVNEGLRRYKVKVKR